MILVSPDKFKGSLSAIQVASILGERLRELYPDQLVVELPIADGGEGTVPLAVRAGMEPVEVGVLGPIGGTVFATYARRDSVAVIEAAQAGGVGLLAGDVSSFTAGSSSTYGVGQLIGHAVDHGATEIVLGLGGSATTDGGAGLASALGARVVSASGGDVPPGGVGLAQVREVDISPLRERLEGVRVILATDVQNRLVGVDGAARVYGPQKGASADLVNRLDANLDHWAGLLEQSTGVDVRTVAGAGAAGGTGVPLLAAGVASIESGAEYLLELGGFAELVAVADLVVVGEGSLDSQSLHGKAPIVAATLAREQGARVVAVVGSNALTSSQLRATPIDRVYAMTDVEPDVHMCISNSHQVLHHLAAMLARTEARLERGRTRSRNDV